MRQLSGSTAAVTPPVDPPVDPAQSVPNERPRWSYTPERMKMPFRVRLVDPKSTWRCNTDPFRLDRFYIKFLGNGADKLLTEEVKWLAVTHKSFEQGARGFNDRLAFLGRRILNLQANVALVSSQNVPTFDSTGHPSDDRVPFTHPALVGLPNLTKAPLSEVLSKEKLADLGTSVGLRHVIRWYPRNIRDMESSGIDTVLATSMYSIFGALALQNGGEVAAELARQHVLKPLQII
ncbi:hypothetical protein K3495_g1779 [Podosphaera aphanis]|nr:hypothetical protein K3495_g1779 [Podosphaera aphanis]